MFIVFSYCHAYVDKSVEGRCIRVIDGDTIMVRLDNGIETVRLIGVDTPELSENEKLYQAAKKDYQASINSKVSFKPEDENSKYDSMEAIYKRMDQIKAMGEEAYKFTRKLVYQKKIRLEFDLGKTDKYGRLLAYVYILDFDFSTLPQDVNKGALVYDKSKKEIFLNASILKSGYADVMMIKPNVKYNKYFLDLEADARSHKEALWSRDNSCLGKKQIYTRKKTKYRRY